MSGTGDSLNKLTVNQVEAAVKEVQKTPGGVKMDIVLSPAVQKITPRSQSQPTTPQTQQEIEEKLNAANSRKECLEKLRMKSIANQLAKIEDVKSKREELNAEVSAKTKEQLETKLETQKRNRSAQLEQQLTKIADKNAKVEKQHKDLEIQTEAARIAMECDITAKLNKAQDNRDSQIEEKVNKLRKHEQYVKEVRDNQEKDKLKLEAELQSKLEKAAKERERQEAELKMKLEEHSKHVQLVRQNKEKLDVTSPESA